MGAFVAMYQSTTFWYPTLLSSRQLTPLAYLLALNAGGVIGSVALGALSEKGVGRRGSATIGVVIALASTPWYLDAASSTALLAAAAAMGFFGAGAWGMVPGYLSERFPTEARGVGTGFSYHAGVGLGSYGPYLIGRFQDGGMPLTEAMAVCLVTAGVLVLVLLWLGPETRGRTLDV